MAQATCASLISEALLQAGDTSLGARAVVWGNQWLRSQYRAWPWPFLQKRASGLTLNSGATSLVVGGGSGGVTDVIQRIYDPLYLYTSDKSTRSTARFSQLVGGSIEFDEDARLNSQIGLPVRFKGRPSSTTWGVYTLIPDPIPDRNLLLSFDYIFQPTDVFTGTTGGSSIPIYPNDRTIVQAIKHMALDYMKSEEAMMALEVLGAMVIDDRMKYGQSPGINDVWQYDGSTFR